MVKSFQYNPRKATEKTEDDVNTLITGTAPLVSTYDDTNNTLTLSVDTGKDVGELLKVGSEITSGQLLKMNNEEVIGISIGKLQSNILQNGADLTSGEILKISGSQVVGEATGIVQDNILVSGGSISNDDYLYNDSGVVKGRSVSEVKQDLDLEDADIVTKMEGIIKYTENSGGNNRQIELITPADAQDGGHTAFTCMTLKPNMIDLHTPFYATGLTAPSLDSGSGGGSLRLKYQGANKIEIANLLNTFEENCRLKKYCSIGEPKFFVGASITATASEVTSHVPICPLMLGVGTDDNEYASSHLVQGNSYYDTYGGSNTLTWRRGFHPSSATTLWADTAYTGGMFSLFANGIIYGMSYIISANGANFYSDDRIKTQEEPIKNATDTIMKLKPCSYRKHPQYLVDEDDESPVHKDGSGNIITQIKESGLIAQQVYRDAPELRHIIGECYDFTHKKNILNMNYTQLIPYLIKSNQELNERIIQLENKINV